MKVKMKGVKELSRNLERLRSEIQRMDKNIKIPLPADDGYIGRECPNSDCLGYFKITSGTGIPAETPCHCPYCGFVADHNHFFTQSQIKYAQSTAVKQIQQTISKALKTRGSLQPIRTYREQQLETEVVCVQCTLRYAIYGLFAFCPDCGTHNSLQILHKNLELAEKEIALAATVEHDLAEHLVGDALENAVSSFDGFGRETCRVRAHYAKTPAQIEKLSFQNLARAAQKVETLFGLNLADGVTDDEWQLALRCFQKRHLLAHSMGIVDKAYIKATSDAQAVIGRKVSIQPDEVAELIVVLKKLGSHLTTNLPS